MSALFNPTVAWITLRATLSRRRALLFALPAAILILLTVALRASRPPMRPWPSHVLGTFGFSVLIPLTALIIGTSVLGAEIDDGSIVHLLATPLRRSSVVVTKFVIATALTIVFAAVPELIAVPHPPRVSPYRPDPQVKASDAAGRPRPVLTSLTSEVTTFRGSAWARGHPRGQASGE